MNVRNLPLGITRSDCESEEQYQYAQQHWDELYNEAEDLAMEEYYEAKYENN